MCPFVQAQLAMVRTQIRIWPNEPWFCDTAEGNRSSATSSRWNQSLERVGNKKRKGIDSLYLSDYRYIHTHSHMSFSLSLEKHPESDLGVFGLDKRALSNGR